MQQQQALRAIYRCMLKNISWELASTQASSNVFIFTFMHVMRSPYDVEYMEVLLTPDLAEIRHKDY